MSQDFVLDKIKREGVRLIVEFDLTYDEFKDLLRYGIDPKISDDEVRAFYEIVNRRILPPDGGSFSGIGCDVGDLFRRKLRSALEPWREF